MQDHYQGIELKINQALDKLEAKKNLTWRDMITAITLPYIDKLADQRGIYYLRIMAQQLNVNSDWLVTGRLEHDDAARNRIFRLFKREKLTLAPSVRETRMILYTTLLFQSLATYSRLEQSCVENPLGDKQQFTTNLIDSLVGVLVPPVT